MSDLAIRNDVDVTPAQPIAATILGLAYGLLLISILYLAVKSKLDADSGIAIGVTLNIVLLEMVGTFALLYGFRSFFPEGFLWFGVAMGVGFLSGVAVVSIRLHKEL